MSRSAAVDVRQDIERSGFYPDVMIDALETALGSESVLSYVVHHEATFDREELRRHATVLVLTSSRLIVCHTDDHVAESGQDAGFATSSTEAVRLEKVDSVVVTRVVADPAGYRSGGAASEVVLTIGWGAVHRIDLEPASCGDPACEADHGLTGSATNDDYSLRVSVAADGSSTVNQILAFARALSEATSTPVR